MPRPQKQIAEKKPEFSIRTINVSENEVATLNRLSRDASDFLGRSISSSAIIRALIRQIGKRGPAEAEALFLEVEQELKKGVLWGKHK